MHGSWAEVHKKRFDGCDLFGVGNELDSFVHYVLISGTRKLKGFPESLLPGKT